MQSCWRTEPDERPKFCNLRQCFDKILTENAEYYGYLQLVIENDEHNDQNRL
jgi:hypothetical protein